MHTTNLPSLLVALSVIWVESLKEVNLEDATQEFLKDCCFGIFVELLKRL